MLEALEEKRRRELLNVNQYFPHPGQLRIHESKAVERFVTSGNAFGKSCLLVNEVLAAATGVNPWTKEHTPVPARCAVLLDSPTKIEEQFLPELRKWYPLNPEKQLEKRGKPYPAAIVFPNGSEIVFYFHQQDPLIFEGIEVDYVFADEPMPRPIYVSLFIRGARTKNKKQRLLCVGTPIAASWMRTEIIEPWARGELENVECFKGSSHENKENLAEGYLERMESRLSDKEKAVRLHGEFYDISGLALAHLWNRSVHVHSKEKSVELRKNAVDNKWPCIVAVDPHPSKAVCAVLMAQDPHSNRVYVMDEFRKKVVPREFATELKDWLTEYRIVDIIVDSLGAADFTGGEGFKSFIQVLSDSGIRARSTSFKEKSDEDFIERIQDALVIPNGGLPTLSVLQWCVGTVSDLENVSWVQAKNLNGDMLKPKLAIDNRDYLACVKYGLAAGVTRKNLGKTHVIRTAVGSRVNYSQRRR
jgi:hypothetical protein